MEGSRGLKVGVLVVALALGAIWVSLGGFRETSGEPFPARTAGQTLTPMQPADSTTEPAPAASSPSSEPTQTSATDATTDPVSGLVWVDVSMLPPEVADTLAAIDTGPPYPYDRDGVTFENREGLLPDEEYGYYQEFTVTTVGSSDRGARRVVWGLGDEFYYTDDHYTSFVRISR